MPQTPFRFSEAAGFNPQNRNHRQPRRGGSRTAPTMTATHRLRITHGTTDSCTISGDDDIMMHYVVKIIIAKGISNMHRVSRALLLLVVLGALAGGALLALGRPDAQAIPGFNPIITVDSTADTNTRDSVMTLREANLVVTGWLFSDLTEGECGQVSPAVWDAVHGFCVSLAPPGGTSADTIIFDPSVFPPANPATINLGETLPDLDWNDDTIDGSSAGVILNGVTSLYTCLDIDSSNNTIKGLEIYNCSIAILIDGNNNTIGGDTPAERNVISSNDYGVELLQG